VTTVSKCGSTIPFKPANETKPEKYHDLAMDIFKVIVSQYEHGHDLTESKKIPIHLGCSRIIYDIHLGNLIREGLVQLSGGFVSLREKGKQFAINQGLVL
jgi:hypothetical protein